MQLRSLSIRTYLLLSYLALILLLTVGMGAVATIYVQTPEATDRWRLDARPCKNATAANVQLSEKDSDRGGRIYHPG